jgi:RNA-directed DNA polymerase
MKAMIAEVNPTLRGWYASFKHVPPSQLGRSDRWVRVRLRSILRKRRGGGRDHLRRPNRYFTESGFFCLLDARISETASFRTGANH